MGRTGEAPTVLCRDCIEMFADAAGGAPCPSCRSRRLIAHPELGTLSLAHLDCDAFYAAVEKRDDPGLLGRPLIIGGGRRGVVSTACYLARRSGVGSAMPMFKARRLCPAAVVISPDMKKYAAVSREVRALMLRTTPAVEPLSIDEAFLDLSGTERLHRQSPAQSLARLARRIEAEIGITVSIGLSYNKFLAKIASDIDKPRGFTAIGRADAVGFLAAQPVGAIFGIGSVMQRRLNSDGLRTLGQVQNLQPEELEQRYGALGRRLAAFSRGEDDRRVNPHGVAKSISAETTLEGDVADPDRLAAQLWPLCEKVARRLKDKNLAGLTITLKLKTDGFRSRTRTRTLADPTQLAEIMFRNAEALLRGETDGTRFRLIGVGMAGLCDGAAADPPDLIDGGRQRIKRLEQTIDDVRSKFGNQAIIKGRSIAGPPGHGGGRRT